MFTAVDPSDYPIIGDWVVVKVECGNTVIEHLIDRRSSFSRKCAGVEIKEQVIPANIISLCGVDLMRIGAIMQSELKGTHTTTHKEIILLKMVVY